jgi:ribonuclease D
MRELIGTAAKTVHTRMEDSHKRRCKARGEKPAPRPHLLPLVTSICWWRAHAARLLDVNPQIVIPNTVVESIAYEAPQSGRAAVQVLCLASQRAEYVSLCAMVQTDRVQPVVLQSYAKTRAT